jgi:hypothetical protein
MAAATSPAKGRSLWREACLHDPERCTIFVLRRPAPGGAAARETCRSTRSETARSPWAGEGHRKVWARLRVIDGIRVGRTRVLWLMGENGLLSPHRRPPRPANDHDGAITTDAPNVMWGADGAVIPTVQDGNVTLFIVAEHWNAEGLGWHRQARQPL